MASTVCILAPPETALLPIRQKSLLTHVLEKFSQPRRFVILIEGSSALVREYLRMAHPTLDLTVRECPTGAWRERNQWKDELGESFYWIEAASFFQDSPELLASSGDALAVCRIARGPGEAGIFARVEEGEVLAVSSDPPSAPAGWRLSTGIAHIASAREFFGGIDRAEQEGEAPGLIHGIQALARDRLAAVPLHDWIPIASIEEYRCNGSVLDPFDFPKAGELLYRVGDRVLKYFEDEAFVRDRLSRAGMRPAFFPEIVEAGANFFSYRYCPGQTLYELGTPILFARLISRLEGGFWPLREQVTLGASCDSFYRGKTKDRVERYLGRAQRDPDVPIVNGSRVPSIAKLLEAVPWSWLSEGIPAFIHGDLQFDNIIYQSEEDRFTLIDWRQDFGGALRAGDLYYDFAKLLAGCEIDFHKLRLRQVGLSESPGEIGLFVPAVEQVRAYRLVIQRSCARNGLDYRKVRLIAALIYLNMAGLHFAPLDRLLFHVGRHQLAAELGLLEGSFRRARYR
jgi:hypothetical protein